MVRSLDEALEVFGDVDEVMVIGGGELYAQCLPRAARMYLTLVHAEVEGDTRFPVFDPADWIERGRESHPADARNPYPYTFVELERRRSGGG